MQSWSSGRSNACGWVAGSCPDHSDDVEIAERHDSGRHDEYVASQEQEVGFALPLGSITARPAAKYRPPTAVRRLDEDEQLR